MKALQFALILALVGARRGGAQSGQSPSAAAAIRRLYATFACETVSVYACGPHGSFTDQPRSVLAQYFDEELVRLWFADRACRHVVDAEDICWFDKLDFSPIWSSQDAVGTTFLVRSTADPSVVIVELHLQSGDQTVLRYSLINTATGWRIHNISNGKLWSLLTMLTKGG